MLASGPPNSVSRPGATYHRGETGATDRSNAFAPFAAGGLVFVDLRDRWGITQVTFHPESEEVFAAAEELRPEWSISIEGEVVARPEGNENPELPTGQIEVSATSLEVLNES